MLEFIFKQKSKSLTKFAKWAVVHFTGFLSDGVLTMDCNPCQVFHVSILRPKKKTIPREPWQTLLHLNDHQVNLRDVNQPTNHNRGFKESYVSLSSNDIHRKKEIHSRSLTARPWKMMVGKLLSFWEGNFSGAILNFRVGRWSPSAFFFTPGSLGSDIAAAFEWSDSQRPDFFTATAS